MSRLLFISSLCLLLLSSALPAIADQYDVCMKVCKDNLAPCIEQAKLNAGNIQEEQDSIAACEKAKSDCEKACSDAEANAQPSQAMPHTQLTALLRSRVQWLPFLAASAAYRESL